MKHWAMLSVLAPISLGANAVSAIDKMIGFTIGETKLAMPLPSGFCEPTGKAADFAKRFAAIDSENQTLATLVACDKMNTQEAFQSYILIKSPNAAANVKMERSQGLDLMEQVMTRPDAPKFDERMSEQFEKDTERELGTAISITGTFGYAGRDKDCIYMAGPMSGSVKGKTVNGLIGTCLTFAGGKMIGVNVYEIPAKTSIPAMKARARTVAMSIRP